MTLENLYHPDCIRTYTGVYFNVFEPDIDKIRIEDIAHALSRLSRFGGHMECFYTVAEHSIKVMKNVPREHKLAALLHDASEAYLQDIPAPIKRRLPDYKRVEAGLMLKIAEKFEFDYPLHPSIKDEDIVQLEFEWNNLVIGQKFIPIMNTYAAKQMFLYNYEMITTL